MPVTRHIPRTSAASRTAPKPSAPPLSGVRRSVSEQDGQRIFSTSHPIPPEPSPDELARYEYLNQQEELTWRFEGAQALIHAMHCLTLYEESERGGGVPNEMRALTDRARNTVKTRPAAPTNSEKSSGSGIDNSALKIPLQHPAKRGHKQSHLMH